MRIFHDWKFVEDGTTIKPLSVGMVREDGTELYRVFRDVRTITSALRNPWLAEHVVSKLPIGLDMWVWDWDTGHPDHQHVKEIDDIRVDIHQFIISTPNVELWADYGAYDHVCLAQLWGPMSDLPTGIPMFTNDLRTRVGSAVLPEQPEERRHHALMDAWQELAWWRWLDETGKGVW